VIRAALAGDLADIRERCARLDALPHRRTP
jgi:hypothetical protein